MCNPELSPNCNGLVNVFLVQRCDLRDTFWYTFQSYSHRLVGIDSTSMFGLVFHQIAAGFLAAICWCFARHCCWHRNFQLATSVFHCVYKFFIIWLMKKIPRNCMALSSIRFLIAHFCFALLFAASHKCFHTLPGLEVVCFLVSLSRTNVSLVIFGLFARTLARLRGGKRAITFPPKADFFVESLSSGPSASRNTFPVSTITDGYARIGSRSSCLPRRRPGYTLSRLRAEEMRPAADPVDSDPGAVFEDDPHPRPSAGRPLEP